MFEDHLGCGVNCGPSPNFECPSGQRCQYAKNDCHMTCVGKASGMHFWYIILQLWCKIRLVKKYYFIVVHYTIIL